MIAEDHLDSREALRILLEALGYQVSTAGDGRAAVELAMAQLPHLILMDVMMPELDGFEATRQLREHAHTRTIPIIAVTAMEGAEHLAREAGADDYLAKPVDTRALMHKIEHHLSRRPEDG